MSVGGEGEVQRVVASRNVVVDDPRGVKRVIQAGKQVPLELVELYELAVGARKPAKDEHEKQPAKTEAKAAAGTAKTTVAQPPAKGA